MSFLEEYKADQAIYEAYASASSKRDRLLLHEENLLKELITDLNSLEDDDFDIRADIEVDIKKKQSQVKSLQNDSNVDTLNRKLRSRVLANLEEGLSHEDSNIKAFYNSMSNNILMISAMEIQKYKMSKTEEKKKIEADKSDKVPYKIVHPKWGIESHRGEIRRVTFDDHENNNIYIMRVSIETPAPLEKLVTPPARKGGKGSKGSKGKGSKSVWTRDSFGSSKSSPVEPAPKNNVWARSENVRNIFGTK